MDINTKEIEKLRKTFRDYVADTEKKLNCTDDANLDDIGIMVYPSVTDIENGKQVSISEIIKDIQTESSRDGVDRKEQLPIAYFSVIGFNGNKTDKNVSCHSGLVVIDIDVKENPNTDFEKLYNDLQWIPHNYLCFRSPNNGIKLVFKTGHECYIPRLPRRKEMDFIPYIFTHEQMKWIYRECDMLTLQSVNMNSAHFAIPALIRFLYSTGVRISEALSIKNMDIDYSHHWIIIRKTKNKMQRLV